MFISNPLCQNSGTTAETLSRGFLPKYLSEIDMGKLAGGCDSTATKQKWRPLVDIPNNSETNWIFLMFILIVYPGIRTVFALEFSWHHQRFTGRFSAARFRLTAVMCNAWASRK